MTFDGTASVPKSFSPRHAPNIVIVKYTIAKRPASLIIVALDGREHSFYLYQMRPVVISGRGLAG